MNTRTENSQSRSIEAELFRYGSVLSSVLVLGGLLYLRDLSMEFSRTPRIFPSVVIHIGLIAATALVIKEVVTRLWKPNLLSAGDDEVMKHLTGAESEFSLPVRVKRLVIIGVWTALFFALSTINVLLAVIPCYVGAAYSLGIRDKRTLILSTITLFAFVYVVFGLLIEIPFTLF